MTLAACLAILGAGAAWWGPRVLRRLTTGGSSPLFGVTMWTSGVIAVLVAWVGAAALVVAEARSALDHPSALVQACLSVLDGVVAGWPPLGWVTAGLIALLLPVLAVFAWRVVRLLSAAGRARRKLIRAVRATGRRDAELDGGALLLESDSREAYSLAGGSGTVVITTAAVAKLSPRELAAVLAHERAHLVGRHQLLLGFLSALHRAAPLVPLFGEAAREVGLLLEMRADDVAARRHGRPALLAALLTMSGTDAPQPALGAGGSSLVPRARRLLEPATQQERVGARLRISAAFLGIAAVAGLALGVLLPQACAVVLV